MTTDEALEWADTWGPVEMLTPSGDAIAMLALATEVRRLRDALRLSANGLRHCARWNISEEKEKAIMTHVISIEAMLPPNAS